MSGDRGAGLDQHIVHLPGGEIGEHLLYVENACRALHANHVSAGIEQRLTFCIVRAVHDGRSGHRQHPRRQRHAQAGIQHGPDRLAAASIERLVTHVERRVVREHGTDSRENRTRSRTQSLHVGARFRPGDPLALAGLHRNPAIQAAGNLETHERPAVPHPAQKACVQCFRRVVHQAAADLNSGGLQRSPAVAADLWKRILHGDHDIFYTGVDQCGRTRRCLAFVRAGLQCQVRGRAARFRSRSAERIDLGMRLARSLVPALANNLAVANQHATYHRIRMCRVDTALRESQGPRHQCAFRGREFSHLALPVLLAQ